MGKLGWEVVDCRVGLRRGETKGSVSLVKREGMVRVVVTESTVPRGMVVGDRERVVRQSRISSNVMVLVFGVILQESGARGCIVRESGVRAKAR